MTAFPFFSGYMIQEDFMVSNVILPIGSLIYLLFCVTRYGWGFDKYLEEANFSNTASIVENAAKVMNTKNNVPQIRPPAI